MLCMTMPYLSKPNCWNIFTMMTRNRWRWTFHTLNPVASTGRRRSCQHIEAKSQRLTAQTMTPKEALEPLASYLDNDHLIPPPLFLSPFSLSVWPSACDKDSWLEPRVHIPLKVPLQMLVSAMVFFLFTCVYFHFNWFFSEAVSGCWWSCWF